MAQLLHTLRDALPEGIPVPARWLHHLGISSALIQVYLNAGWLQALPGHAYMRPGGELSWPATLYAAQQLGLPVHVGHLSALDAQGLSHYQPLGGQAPLHLYLAGRPPTWLTHLPSQTVWHHERLFTAPVPTASPLPSTLRVMDTAKLKPPAAHKLGVTLTSRLPWPVFVSAPERAALELAAGLTRGDSWDTAYETFSGLTMLRPAVVHLLLKACTRIVVRRIFLHLAQDSGHAWLKHVPLDQIDLGKGDRQLVKQGRLDPTYRITVPERDVTHGF